MRSDVIWAIRDARDLTEHEKMFLFITESRGSKGMYGNWKTDAADMGMSKDTFYRTRNSLCENGLIILTVRMNDKDARHKTTVYRVNHSLIENRYSLTENNHSHQTEQKDNSKRELKGQPVPGGPEELTSSLDSLSDDLNLGILDNVQIDKIEVVTDTPRSHTENGHEEVDEKAEWLANYKPPSRRGQILTNEGVPI